MSADAVAFIKPLGLAKVDVLGFSFGGFVAEEIALQAMRLTSPMSFGSGDHRAGAGRARRQSRPFSGRTPLFDRPAHPRRHQRAHGREPESQSHAQSGRFLCRAPSSSQRPEDRKSSSLAPGPREVRIEVKAIGINRAESMWRNDKYVEPVKYPAGLGFEAAGVVDAVGKDVTGVAVGDAVSTIPAFSQNKYSTYGELILVPDYAVVKHPKSLSFTEAASIWMMFVTAYGALVVDAKVTEGDFVIIPAASSSVGLAAIQLANYAGATPIALTRTSAKRKRLLEAGAAHVVATEEVDLALEAMRITDGKGARVVFDPVGGPNFTKLISALAYQGIIYLYGALSEDVTAIPILKMIPKLPTVKVYSLREVAADEGRRKAAVEYICKGLESRALKPIIDRTFKFDEMVEAHRYLEGNSQFGKIVVTV
jgi:NADPH:quinone reductase-like Zn-dependent oxidoreductase